MKVTAVEKGSAEFAVVKVLKGDLKPKEITIRWTATQKPPVEPPARGAPAVLLVPKDEEDPTLLQVSPEFLSLAPLKNKPGQYEFLRLNGFVKGSFNGEAADLIHLIEDTLNGRGYFPIWADTSFAPARKIGALPAPASALAVGDLDGEGRLDIVAATAGAMVAFAGDGKGKLSRQALQGVDAGASLQLADADGDGKLDVLTESGLFLNKGGRRFAPAVGTAGRKWSTARFCYLPGRPAPAIAAVEAGRARLFARAKSGRWGDISGQMGLDRGPGNVAAISLAVMSDRLAVVLPTSETLTSLEAASGKPLSQVQCLRLADRPKSPPGQLHIAQRDMDGDGALDVLTVCDGRAGFFRRRNDGTLAEVADHLGDVRRVFQAIEGCGGLICEDFNNDGLIDLVTWSKSRKISLIMNRGHCNLRGGTELFDLPAALKDLSAVQSVAAADIDGDGDLDLIVASGDGLYLLSNTFEKKPEDANARPRNPLLTVRAPGRFGALITVEDKHSRRLASRRVGSGPMADTVHFGYRSPLPAAVVLTMSDGKIVRRPVPAGSSGRPIVFR